MVNYEQPKSKINYESALVLGNTIVVFILLIIRLLTPAEGFVWDITTILVSVVSLFISQWLIRINTNLEENRVSRYIAIGMASFACLMIVTSILTITL